MICGEAFRAIFEQDMKTSAKEQQISGAEKHDAGYVKVRKWHCFQTMRNEPERTHRRVRQNDRGVVGPSPVVVAIVKAVGLSPP